MRAFTECPKVGDRVYGQMLTETDEGVIERMGWGTVRTARESEANEGLANVFVDGDDCGDDLDWGCHSFWSIRDKRFTYKDDILLRPASTGIPEAFDKLKQYLDAPMPVNVNADLLYWHYALAKAELKVANVLRKGQSQAMSKLNTARAAWQRALTGRKPAEHYEYADYETTIAGIPCGIVVLSLAEGRCNTWGHPDNQEPDDPAEIEFVVVDRKGWEADWLRAKVDDRKLENHVWSLVHGRPVGVGVY